MKNQVVSNFLSITGYLVKVMKQLLHLENWPQFPHMFWCITTAHKLCERVQSSRNLLSFLVSKTQADPLFPLSQWFHKSLL
jgi:hypothetical protein